MRFGTDGSELFPRGSLQRPPTPAAGRRAAWLQAPLLLLLAQGPQNLLLVFENKLQGLVILLNAFLILSDGGLIVFDRLLVVPNRLLVFKNRRLILENLFLVCNNLFFSHLYIVLD